MFGQIEVTTLNGDTLNVESHEELFHVKQLKQIISYDFGIPCSCQQLVSSDGITPLRDLDRVEDQCYRLVLTFDELRQKLNTSDINTQRNAIQDLSVLGPQGGDAALNLLVPFLQHQLQDIRMAASNAVSRISPDVLALPV
mmetsp:Transcript_123734/g.194086  ORF Transcript_123734/g.194086 Transcript_123734/m.194086 type:complete len:141 (+) Transcript_123734:51-473(+)|eukprot:CAMPEP_0169131594 /NCGR_PEP_ID=MMETSP1015-20121227/38331_1 /TAXON_ID=342587 /ORGANISM="Karlodinium micrum, Strain CCMP2283" /LENGTH=140 /DNA_ID=CAMNT_0009195867 /DNA_START=51 /DNA_END=473 /DNA_ORIENTATION=-